MTLAQARALIAALPRVVAGRLALSFDEAAGLVADEMRRRLTASPVASRARRRDALPPDTLADSIATGRDLATGTAIVTVAAPYAADVEYGTARQAARPFLRPAIEQVTPEIRGRLAADLKQAVADALDMP